MLQTQPDQRLRRAHYVEPHPAADDGTRSYGAWVEHALEVLYAAYPRKQARRIENQRPCHEADAVLRRLGVHPRPPSRPQVRCG